MEQSYDINEVPPDDDAPSIKRETENAKLYLQKFCHAAGDNIYDHLSEVLSRILSERPQNPFAFFDEYSKKLRDDKFRMRNDYLRDLYVPPVLLKNAKKLVDLFKVNLLIVEDNESLEDGNEEVVKTVEISPNLFDIFYYLEQCDIGIPRSESVLLNLSIRKLVAKTGIKDVRFWGKIFGRQNNYYIIEATLADSTLERRLEELEKENKSLSSSSAEAKAEETSDEKDAEKQALEAAMATELSAESEEQEPGIVEDKNIFKFELPPLPENTWKPPPDMIPEQLGTGVNAQIYFVCNSPGLEDWTELPTVTPQQIIVARHTVHAFTGNLESKISTFPPFPGCEKNYLRAQIARIGASTHVSPVGYYTFGSGQQEDDEFEEEEEENDDDEDEGEEGDEGEGSEVVKNKRYEQLPIKELIDPSMSNWCHRSPYLLKQGRVIWQDPTKLDDESGDNELGEEGEKSEEAEEEDEEEKEEDEDDEMGNKDKEIVKEIGPPLLTPLSEDAASGLVTPWTARQSSRIQPDTAVAFVQSNLWPGAFAYAADNKFGNVYIGWGHKHDAYNYNPPLMPAIQDQYSEINSELVEMQDPSFEEEEAYRLAHLPPPYDDGEEYENEEETDETETGNDDED